MLHEVASRFRTFVADVTIDPFKLDTLVLSSMDRVRKIAEAHGAYVMMPAVGKRVNVLRVQVADPPNSTRALQQILRMVCLGGRPE
jgi:hypothetical protein